MFKNWKTSLFGIGAVITGIATIISGDVVTGVTAILSGLGLIAAKDSNTDLNGRK
jgi:L-aminopeptidase/D-esterase-like protein|tara:strand:- start:3636 stop:3800 length:165 start_codon:yes stop_codon:yes gene_type:complete